MKRKQRIDREEHLRKTESSRKCMEHVSVLQSGKELTTEGWLFCIVAGILETISVLTVFRLDLEYVPLIVFMVLCAAFGIITSVFLIGTGNAKADLCTVRKQEYFRVSDQRDIWNVKKAS